MQLKLTLCLTLVVKQRFPKENLLRDLGIQGRKTSITVKIMNEEVTKSSDVLEDQSLFCYHKRRFRIRF